jgi:hypothetical protein
MSEDTFYIDIDSKNRNRNDYPNVSDFSIPFELNRKTDTKNNSNDPISNSYPTHEWQWNSQPPITIINGSSGYSNTTDVQVLGGSGSGMTVDIIADGFLPMASSIKSRTRISKPGAFTSEGTVGNTLDETVSEQNNINSVLDTNYAFELTTVGSGFINNDNFTNFTRTTGIGNFDTGTSFRVSIINCVKGGIETFTITTAGTGYAVGDTGLLQPDDSSDDDIDGRMPSSDGVYKVTSISGSSSTGPVTGVDILYCGEGYGIEGLPQNVILQTNGNGDAVVRIDTVTSIGTNNSLGNIQAIYMNTTDINGTGFKDGDTITFTSPTGGTNAVYTIRKSGLCDSKVSKITINTAGHGYIPGETVYLDSMSSSFGLVITDFGSGYKDGGAIKTQSITTAGTGYSEDDTSHCTEIGNFHILKYATYLITGVGGGGSVTGVSIPDPGKGYRSGDVLLLNYNEDNNAKITVGSVFGENVSTIGGSGTGLTIDYTTKTGIIDTLTINNQGSSYVDGDVLHVLGETTLTGVAFAHATEYFGKSSHGLLTGMYVAITSGTISSSNINFSLNTRYYLIKIDASIFQLALPTSNTTVITGSSDMTGLTLTVVTGPTFMLENCKFRVGESFDVIVDEYYISKSTDMILTASSTSGSGTGMKIKLANINRVLASPYDESEGCEFLRASATNRDIHSWKIYYTNPTKYRDITTGDAIVFPVSGGGASGFSINTTYYIISFIHNSDSSSTVQLSLTPGGTLIEGGSESTGGTSEPSWYACSVETVIECIYDMGTGYDIGDTVTFTNNIGSSVTLTITNSTIFGGAINNDNFISDSKIQAFNQNQIYISDGVTQNLHTFENFYKGLIFENTTQGVSSRITHYDNIDNIITLEHFIPITLNDSWKIQNPSTKNKVFIPGGSDNDNNYVGDYYQAVMFTGNSYNNNNYESFVTTDHRTISQFKKIIKYDGKSKIATLESSLHSFTNCANKLSLQQDIILSKEEKRPSTLYYKSSGGSFSSFSSTGHFNTATITNYSGDSTDIKFNSIGTGYELTHYINTTSGTLDKSVKYYSDYRFTYSLGVDYKMFDTVSYSVSDGISTDSIRSILFTRLLLKGVKGSISFNRIRKELPVLPTNNTSIVPGINKSNSMSVNINKNFFSISKIDIINGGTGYREGDQILLFPSMFIQIGTTSITTVITNIFNKKTVNCLTILSVTGVSGGVITSMDIISAFTFLNNTNLFPNVSNNFFNDIVVPDMSQVTTSFYPDSDNLNNNTSLYAFVVDSKYYDNPSQSSVNTDASGGIFRVMKVSNVFYLPTILTNKEITRNVLENTYVNIPYYNTNNGLYISDATESYTTKSWKSEGSTYIGQVNSIRDSQNFNKLVIPQRLYKITNNDLSTNNITVKNILNGDTILIYSQYTYGADKNEHQNTIKTVHSISNKLLINYGENYSQFRMLNNSQTLTLNSKTVQPVDYIISKTAEIGSGGMEGIDNFVDLKPMYIIESDDFLLNCNDTPFEVLPFSKDNSVSLTHNKVLQKPKDTFRIYLQQLILPNKIQGKYLYNQRYILLEFSNENTVNQTSYSSNNVIMRNILFKCIPMNDFNETNKFIYFKSDDIHNLQINLNNDFRLKIMFENGDIIIPNEEENCLIKSINENIQINSLFKLERIKLEEESDLNMLNINNNLKDVIENQERQIELQEMVTKVKKKRVVGDDDIILLDEKTIIKKKGQKDIFVDTKKEQNYNREGISLPIENYEEQYEEEQEISEEEQILQEQYEQEQRIIEEEQILQEQYEQEQRIIEEEQILQEQYEQEQRIIEEEQILQEQEISEEQLLINIEIEREKLRNEETSRQILLQQELERRFEEDLQEM